MARKRIYRLDPVTLITDDGFTLAAEHRPSETYSSSIGIKRPFVGEIPNTLAMVVSKSQKYFYLKDFTDIRGCWFGFETWDSKEALLEFVKKASQGLITEPYYIEVTTREPPRTYYRETLPFDMFDIKALPGTQNITKDNEAAKDALAAYAADQEKQKVRFNEVIKHTGRDLDWIMAKIGAWVPFEEDPIVELAD